MISKKLEQALNKHMSEELFSAYLYFAMSAYFQTASLDGFGSWMRCQALEELSHTSKFYGYILERGGKPELMKIDAPKNSWDSSLNVFEEALSHEEKITSLINGLVDIASEEKDHATGIFLQWFVTEQVEEEATSGKIVDQLKLLASHPGGIYMLDKELSARTANPDTLFPAVFTAGQA